MLTYLQAPECKTSASFAFEIDAQDSLKNFREKFYIPKQSNGEDAIYFTGNSLELQSKSTRNYIEQELKDGETLGVEAHLRAKNPYLCLAANFGNRVA